MPRQNGTGPVGEGPLTGKGRGECNAKTREELRNCTPGFGWRGGRGQGRGAGGHGRGGSKRWGWGIGDGSCRRFDGIGQSWVEAESDQEIAALQDRMQQLRQAQEAISRRIEEIKAVRME